MNNRTKEGKFSDSATWIEKKCIFWKCGNIFSIKESALKYGRGKYCSRTCCDEHKKEICVGEGNGAFGRKEDDEHKKQRLEKVWSSPTIRDRIKSSLHTFRKQHGHWPGTGKISNKKRQTTIIEKYGVDHIWKVKEIHKKCHDTCIQKYGKTPWQLMIEALKIHQTEIEVITKKVLETNHIPYQSQFQLWDNGNIRIYDYYIPSAHLLVELDGDFWHANPNTYQKEKLLEVQRANILNDEYKTKIAKTNGYNIERFWESQIKLPNYPQLLLHTIHKYENVTTTKTNQS